MLDVAQYIASGFLKRANNARNALNKPVVLVQGMDAFYRIKNNLLASCRTDSPLAVLWALRSPLDLHIILELAMQGALAEFGRIQQHDLNLLREGLREAQIEPTELGDFVVTVQIPLPFVLNGSG